MSPIDIVKENMGSFLMIIHKSIKGRYNVSKLEVVGRKEMIKESKQHEKLHSWQYFGFPKEATMSTRNVGDNKWYKELALKCPRECAVQVQYKGLY